MFLYYTGEPFGTQVVSDSSILVSVVWLHISSKSSIMVRDKENVVTQPQFKLFALRCGLALRCEHKKSVMPYPRAAPVASYGRCLMIPSSFLVISSSPQRAARVASYG